MSESAWGLRRRAAVSQESSLYTSDGSWLQLRGIEGLQVTIDQEPLADDRHVTSRKSNYSPHLGHKKATATFRIPWHLDFATDCAPLLKSCFGFKSSASLTYNDSGSGVGTIVKSAGTHDPIVAPTLTSGSVITPRPIKSVSSNDGTLAIQLASDPSACTNADATGGALYYYDPTADTFTVQMEVDRAGENDALDYVLKGGVVTSMSLELDLGGRMGFQFTVEFNDWSQATASNVSNPSALSGHFLGASAEAFIQDAGTPAAGTQRDIARLSIDLAPERVLRTATRSPGGTVPGSATVGIYTGRFSVGGLKLTFTKIVNTYQTAWEAKTPLWAFFNWYMGRPGASTTKDVMSLSLPRCIQNARPVEVELDGLVGLETSWTIEEDVSLTAPYGLPAFGIFSAA